MVKGIIKKIFAIIMIAVLLFSNLPFELISRSLVAYQESRNIVDKFWNSKADKNVVDNLGLYEMARRLKVEKTEAANAGQMVLYYHKEASDINHLYNSLNWAPPEPAADTASGRASTVLANANPPTALCESSDINVASQGNYNKIGTAAGTAGQRKCMASFISPPVGANITMTTTDAVITPVMWYVDQSTTGSASTVSIYYYKYCAAAGGDCAAAGSLVIFKSFTSTAVDPGTTATKATFTAAAPDATVLFTPADRIASVVVRTTPATPTTGMFVLVDNTARTGGNASRVILKYSTSTPNKPVLSGAKDDDFTVGAATTACSAAGVAYNTKWTCIQGTAASTAGAINNGNTAGTIGDTSDWLWLKNQTTATTAVPSNFGAIPSNTFLWQSLNAGYGDGTVRTVINSSASFSSGATVTTAPWNHSGLALWASNTDYIEVQVNSIAQTDAASVNSVQVTLNNCTTGCTGNNGVLTNVSLNPTTTSGVFHRVWVGFQNTSGSYQAQYSIDGTTWNSIGAPLAHTAFNRVGLNSFARLANPVTSYAGAFEWFQYTLAPPSVNPDAISFMNNTEGTLLDGGRSGQQITISGTNFGAGPSNGTTNAVKIGTYIVPNVNVITWNATTIVFTIPAAATVYGGTLANGLIIRAGGFDDSTPLDFYIYPNIASISANSGQVGSTITISGDHFGAIAGAVTINTKTAAVGIWGETSLLNVKIPGQEGAVNINGKIQLARSDAKASNQYPANPSDFIILAPSVIGSNPAAAATGQTLSVEFSGSGIDTETGIAPTLKLTKTGQADITGISYLKVADYQTVSASFDLTGAATGYWKLVIVNMDGQSGSFGDEVSMGFNISPLAPTVTGINPGFGSDSGVTNIASVTGINFQSDAEVKLAKTAEADIVPSTVFTYTDTSTLSSGVFSLSGKTNGWWNVVVTNVAQGTSGTYGNEINAGFQIRSSKPSIPANIYQFKTNADSAQPPTANIAAGDGVGGQVAVYFRMDMEGGITGENYFPQVEVKPVGAAFECGNASPTPCVVTGGSFAEGSGVLFNGIAKQGWVAINGVDGDSYHWQVRVRNSGGTSNWVSFGGNNDPNDTDFYIDNSPPVISLGTDNTCTTAAPSGSITDLSALIQWNTSDNMSGAASVFPGSGAYAKVQVDYKKGIEPWSTTVLSSWENSMHQVVLSGLSPATVYAFRVHSQDYLGNESISAECSLATASSRPIKTVEFFIGQEADSYKNLLPDGISKKYFAITLPESPASAISVKSAFIEITGVASPAISQTVNVGLLREDQTLLSGPIGENYALNSDSTTTPFIILFNALSPSGTGQESMADITTGATPYGYTLFLKGDGVTDIWLFSAKLVITYSYEL